ncbi:MAG: hypothetical protein ACRC2J_05375 [Microcoleaceae cyanobacterium]
MEAKQSKQKGTKKNIGTYKGKSKEASAAIAATIGRKKYGQKKMTAWSSQGKQRSNKKKVKVE